MSSITKVKSGYQARVRLKNYPTQVKNFQYRSDKAVKEITLLRQQLVEFAQLRKIDDHLAFVVKSNNSLATKASLQH
ncbi:MAG: hypothetical protein ACJ0HT_00160 [Alphaproteobacteria bacterium]